MAAAPAVRFPVFGFVRLLGLAAAAAILVWAVHFRGGMALSSEKDKLLIFNVIEKQRYLVSLPFYCISRFELRNYVLISLLPSVEKFLCFVGPGMRIRGLDSTVMQGTTSRTNPFLSQYHRVMDRIVLVCAHTK
jgi:hypothetical protein